MLARSRPRRAVVSADRCWSTRGSWNGQLICATRGARSLRSSRRPGSHARACTAISRRALNRRSRQTEVQRSVETPRRDRAPHGPGVIGAVPIDFLSPGQLTTYGRYTEAPSVAQLERFFHFDERDRALIARRRGDHNRLGFAVQLGTVRFLGTFLAPPTEVPEIVAGRVAEELAVDDPGRLAGYGRRDPTHREHAGEIQREYGYRDFSDASAQAELLGWLGARAWATAERPSVLFDLATARLIEGKVLLPGASVLARAVTAALDRAAARLYRSLSGAAAAYRGPRFDGLLDVPEGKQLSRWEELRAGPRKLTANEVAESFERLAAIRAVGVGDLTVDVPAGRLRALAQYGLSAKFCGASGLFSWLSA